jgi:hypothetical protein
VEVFYLDRAFVFDRTALQGGLNGHGHCEFLHSDCLPNGCGACLFAGTCWWTVGGIYGLDLWGQECRRVSLRLQKWAIEMSTKRNGVSCYDKAEMDEPLFVLRAHDILAADAVRAWADLARRHGVREDKVDEALRCAKDMDNWKDKKFPD